MSHKKKNISHRVAGFTPSSDQKPQALTQCTIYQLYSADTSLAILQLLNQWTFVTAMLNRLYDIQRSAAIFL